MKKLNENHLIIDGQVVREVSDKLSLEKAVELINNETKFLEASISGNNIMVENFYDITKEEEKKDIDLIKNLVDSWLDEYIFSFNVYFDKETISE